MKVEKIVKNNKITEISHIFGTNNVIFFTFLERIM